MKSRILLAAAVASVLAAGACKPEKTDVQEARHEEAKARAEQARKAVEAQPKKLTGQGLALNLSEEDAARVVARIGDRTITLEDVARRIAQEPAHMQVRYATPERRVQLVKSMVEFEVLLKEALDRGLDRSPRVQAAYEQALARELLEQQGAAGVSMTDIDDAEVARYYEAHKDEFTTPERRRAAMVVLASDKHAGEVRQAIVEAIEDTPLKARQIFGDYAARLSMDKPTQMVRGDLGWFDASGEPDPRHARPDDKAVDVAFTLRAVGDVSEPFQLSDGKRWALLQLTGLNEASERKLADALQEIRNTLFTDKQVAARKAFIAGLVAKADVKVDEAALEKLPKPKEDAAAGGKDPSRSGVRRGLVGRPRLTAPKGVPKLQVRRPVPVELRKKAEEVQEDMQRTRDKNKTQSGGGAQTAPEGK